MTDADESLHVLMLTKEWPTADKPGRAPYIEQQFRYLTAAGVVVDFFTFAGDKNPLNYLKAWWSVQRRLRERRYDVVHAQFGQTGVLAAPKRLPLVVTYRGSDLEGIVGSDGRYTLAGRVLRGISRWVAGQADEICLVSESLSRQLPAGCPFHVIPSGLNLDAFRPIDREEARRHIGEPGDGLRVLFGGDPAVVRKRFPLAQHAVNLLSTRIPARLVVADRVPHSEMPWHVNASNVLLLTSMHEGSPNVVKEALACDVPVVSVDVGDVRMRIGSLEGCRVCGDDRPETIAKALEEVLTRDAPFSGRQTVAGLDERELVRRMIEIYRSAMARYRARV